MEGHTGNFEYTAEEIKAIENAMKQKEFRDLLVQYVEEISDPKNKEEYDQYLKELEGKQELPKGMKLIHPTACFCLKTRIKNKKNASFNQKLFVNVCMTPELDKPSQEKDKKNSQNERGQQWHIPYSCGKTRMDQDKDKNVCQTLDIAFHPLTFEFCRKTEAFKKMICEISIEAAGKQLKDPEEAVSKDYKILTRMKCKGGKPAAMPVRLDQKPGDHSQPGPATTRNEDFTPKLYQEFMKQQKDHKDTKATTEQKPAGAGKVVELASHTFETIPEKPTDIEQEEDDKLKKIIAPKYNILHSYGVEYSDFLMNGGPDKGKKIPKQLVVKIEVPRVQKMRDLDLDINEKQLVLKAANKYYLDITLPYKVNSDEGSAKFDSKTKVLTVTLPTVREQVVEEQQDSQLVEEVRRDGEAEDVVDEEETQKGSSVLNIVTKESQSKYREEQEKMIERIGGSDKKLVEEVETKENKEVSKKETKKQKRIERSFDFLTQETFENFFFIFNVLNYEREKVRVAFLDEEVLFSYEDQDRDFKSQIKILKSYNKKESLCNLVKDYIVINLKKTQGEFWEKNGHEKQEYQEDFLAKLDAYEEEERLEKERNPPEEKPAEEARKEEEEDEDDQEEEKIKEEAAQKNKEADEKKIEERYVEKRSINFINFPRDNFVFEMD